MSRPNRATRRAVAKAARRKPLGGVEATGAAVSPVERPESPVTPIRTRQAVTRPYSLAGDPQMPTPEPDNRWKPTRKVAAHRRSDSHGLTPEQQELAEDLHIRALAIRAASEEGLSIREAVALAAVQLGLDSPRFTTEGMVD